MKPGDHPEFFRMAAPPGTSRESTIRLDAEGHFWHDGEKVDHPALEAALHSWIARHPEDGRFILTNGYDWTYFQVDATPYFVRAVRARGDILDLELSDSSWEAFEPATLCTGAENALYVRVKGGAFEARFTRHAQLALEPWLSDAHREPNDETPSDGRVTLEIAGRAYPIPERVANHRAS